MLLTIQNPKSKTTNGFTLIEMLVVLLMVLVLTTLVVIATQRMGDKDTLTTGASFIQGNLAQARVRALAERRPVGIRLLVAPQGTPPGVPIGAAGIITVDHLQFIHDPGDFADGFVTTDADPATPGEQQIHPETGAVLPTTDPLYGRLIYGPPAAQVPYAGFSFADALDPSNNTVFVGDAVEFHGGGQLTRVEINPTALGLLRSVYHPSQTGSLNRTLLVLDRKLDHPIQVPNVLTPRSNYRIMRQPRAIPGEAPVPLPRNVFIVAADLSASGRQSEPPFLANGDILFDPSGRVVATALESIFLWVSDVESSQPTPVDTNWAIVGIQTRTGSIAIYPVDLSSPPTSYYNHARTGRGAGM